MSLAEAETMLGSRLGLTESEWLRVQYIYLSVAGDRYTAKYSNPDDWIHDGFNQIAEFLIKPTSDDAVIDRIAVALVFICRMHWPKSDVRQWRRILQQRMMSWTGKLGIMKTALPQPAPVVPQNPTTPSGFMNRAVWLKNRLTERKWNKNTLEKFHGPEHRTTQNILDGKPVGPSPLRKVVTALNAHPHARKAKFSDIPND